MGCQRLQLTGAIEQFYLPCLRVVSRRVSVAKTIKSVLESLRRPVLSRSVETLHTKSDESDLKGKTYPSCED